MYRGFPLVLRNQKRRAGSGSILLHASSRAEEEDSRCSIELFVPYILSC